MFKPFGDRLHYKSLLSDIHNCAYSQYPGIYASQSYSLKFPAIEKSLPLSPLRKAMDLVEDNGEERIVRRVSGERTNLDAAL